MKVHKLVILIITVFLLVTFTASGCKLSDRAELEERIEELERQLVEQALKEEIDKQKAEGSAEETSKDVPIEGELEEEVVTDDTARSGWKTYTNEDYNFKIQYPEALSIENSFTNYHNLTDSWRYGAVEDSGGKLVLSIIVYRVENEDSYPRYFGTELRIGVSNSSNDIENCLTYDEDIISNLPIETEVINGFTFNKLIIQDAATMQYVEGISYRIIHDERCFAIEQLKTGSNYRDEPSLKDISDSELDSYYDLISEIIKTFEFITTPSEDSVSLLMDTMGISYSWQSYLVKATPYDNSGPPGPIGLPQHLQIRLMPPDAEESPLRNPIIYIIPVEEYKQLYENNGDQSVSSTISMIQEMIQDRPDPFPINEMPILPFEEVGGVNDIAVQGKHLEFNGLEGFRFTGRFVHDLYPITNDGMLYIFQGFAGDVSDYLIVFFFPVTSDKLPDIVEPEELENISSDPETYRVDMANLLNEYKESDWDPNLATLDDILASLNIEAFLGKLGN
jgi:hypothetical protein